MRTNFLIAAAVCLSIGTAPALAQQELDEPIEIPTQAGSGFGDTGGSSIDVRFIIGAILLALVLAGASGGGSGYTPPDS